MPTASEEILARYRTIEREADSLGRTFGVRRLNSAQQIRVMEMTSSDNDSVRAALFAGASVCEVDSSPITFPRTRAELDSVLTMLDQEGMIAIGVAINRLLGSGEDGEGSQEDVAKKSLGTV